MSDEQNFPGDESVEQALRVGLEDFDLSDEDLAGVDKRLKPSVREVLTIDGAVASRDTKGGTAGARVAEQREKARERVAAARTWAQTPLR